MELYDPNNIQHGELIGDLWSFVHGTGEIEYMTAMGKNTSLPKFCRMFEPPMVAVMDTDKHGIWFLCWFEPLFSVCFFSLWIRQDKRDRRSLRILYNVYDNAFKIWPVLLGITKNPRLLKPMTKLGYHVVGKLPKLFGNIDGYLVQLNKDSYESKRRV